MTGEESFYVSSSLVKEVALLGGDVTRHRAAGASSPRSPRNAKQGVTPREARAAASVRRSSRRSRSPSPPRRPSSRPRASTSSASAPASPTSTRRRTSRTPRKKALDAGATSTPQVEGTPCRCARRSRELDRQGPRPDDRARARSSCQLGRQAVALQRCSCAARRGRRGHHPGAVLGQLPRHRQAGGRPAGDPRRPRPRTTSRSPPRTSPRRSRRAREMILVCSPSNPTGAIYDEATLRGARQAGGREGPLADHRRHLPHAGLRRRASSSSRRRSAPRSRAQTIIVDGVSKTYAMTGWRIGFTVAPEAADRGDGDAAGPVDHERGGHRAGGGAGGASRARPTSSRRCATSSTSAAR